MRAALVLTPDRKFFGQAVFTAASYLAQPDGDALEVIIACEPGDVWDGFDRLPQGLASRISLHLHDFSGDTAHLPERGSFSRAVYRRLLLDEIIDPAIARLIPIDADMWIARPGIGKLASLPMQGHALAAGLDMIYLMDHKGGTLAGEFMRYRLSLGLDPETPYFNNGLTVIDRALWRRRGIGRRALELIAQDPERYPFLDQSALNYLLAGDFLPLSPRYNFMGDFLTLGLEDEIAPIVYHFVNRPKPWEEAFTGERRFAARYDDWFASSPWPEMARRQRPHPVPAPIDTQFRTRLLDFLAAQGLTEQVPAFIAAAE